MAKPQRPPQQVSFGLSPAKPSRNPGQAQSQQATQPSWPTALTLAALTAALYAPAAQAQYAPNGVLMQGNQTVSQGDAYNNAHVLPHQDPHYVNNAAVTVVTSTGVSNSTDPSFVQATQAALEGAASSAVGGASRTGAILYVDGNPYNNGGTVQNQQNFTTYNQLYLNAQGAYTPIAADDGITYFTHTGAGSNRGLVGAVIQSAPETGDFQGAKALSNGQGAVITTVTQNPAAVAHLENLRSVAGSNMYTTFYVRQKDTEADNGQGYDTGKYITNSYQGEVALNSAYNHNESLNLGNYAGFDAAAAGANAQSQQFGVETGFYINRDGTTQGFDGVVGSDFILAAYNPNAAISAHTHPGTLNGGMPSLVDMFTSAISGQAGAAIGSNSSAAYGFRQIGGLTSPLAVGDFVFFRADGGETTNNLNGSVTDNTNGRTYSGDIGTQAGRQQADSGHYGDVCTGCESGDYTATAFRVEVSGYNMAPATSSISPIDVGSGMADGLSAASANIGFGSNGRVYSINRGNGFFGNQHVSVVPANQIFGSTLRGAGYLGITASVVNGAVNVSNVAATTGATSPETTIAITSNTGSIVGGISLGAVGAQQGALLGLAVAGPPGAIIGGVIGGIGGSVIGSQAGGIAGSAIGAGINTLR